MPTETLAVTFSSASPGAAWAANIGNQTTAVALPDDDGTSYIAHSTLNESITYTVGNLASVQPGDTINSVTFNFRGLAQPELGVENVPITVTCGAGTDDHSVDFTGSYSLKSFTKTLDPDDAAWTITSVNALSLTIFSLDSTNTRITSISVDVDYTVQSGGPRGGTKSFIVDMVSGGIYEEYF